MRHGILTAMRDPRIDHAGGRESADRELLTPELPAEHALLGLLALTGGTAHGYELARQFRRGQPLGEVIRLESAMLYKHLKKLARLGWLTMTIEEQAPRPPRQVCTLTPSGEAELRRWLTEPVARTREIRLEFLVKLYFARRLDPLLAQRLVDEQRAVTAQLTESLAAQLYEAAGAEDDTEFARLVLGLRLKQTRAAQDWLDDVVAAFRAQSKPAPLRERVRSTGAT
jgi:PadR family transcriptional regulator, regulatory protein AphA